jgi:starch synthase
LVHHGHQHLITDGYDNHEGLSEVLEAFSAVLALHLRYRVPINLHLSGTLLEAAAWGAPDFFQWARALHDEGLVEFLGSAYSQAVLPLFGAEHNRRQVTEHLALLRRHLGIEPVDVAGFWVPERVWDTRRLAPLIRDPDLPNGGYRWALVDDRIFYSTAGGPGSERARFDRTTVPHRSAYPLLGSGDAPSSAVAAAGEPWAGDGRHLRPWSIEGAAGLVGVPMSGDLRYAIPPRDPGAWKLLHDHLRVTAEAGPGALAVYADDLEKSAAVGPWTPGRWRREGIEPYEALLRWLSTTNDVETVLLTPWLRDHPPAGSRPVDPGTFYELVAQGAGEDYQGWWASDAYAPYRRHLETVQARLVEAGPRRPDPGHLNGTGDGHLVPGLFVDLSDRRGLLELAWKQLMAGTYETAWHGLGGAAHEIAPWARACASHARSALVTLAAEECRRRPVGVRAWAADLDGDGEDEVVLANDRLFAVLSPRYGGRLIALYDLAPPGGRQVVGNPADDWNWQEELNRAMEVPANHPGAFADVGHENEPWVVESIAEQPSGVEVVLRHAGPDSAPLLSSVKRFRLDARSDWLDADYRFTDAAEHFAVEFGLSPDYLCLLREGAIATPVGHGRVRGFAAGQAQVWIELPPGEPLVWEPAGSRPAGHVLRLRVSAWRPDFRLRLGVGAVPGDELDLRTVATRAIPSTPGAS